MYACTGNGRQNSLWPIESCIGISAQMEIKRKERQTVLMMPSYYSQARTEGRDKCGSPAVFDSPTLPLTFANDFTLKP